MMLDNPETTKLWTDLKGLEGKVLAALNDSLAHLPSKRALVIAGARVQEAWLHPTHDNITKAASAIEQAHVVYCRVVKFAAGKGLFGDIGGPLQELELDYVKDFPVSWMAKAITTGEHYVSP